MIINDAEVTTLEELDASLIGLDLASQQMLREIWSSEYQILETQKQKREFGQSKIDALIDKMGERNQQLINSGVAVNVIAIASDNAGLKLLIETGALANAVSLCGLLKYKYPTHKDIYEETVKEFSDYLSSKGWL